MEPSFDIAAFCRREAAKLPDGDPIVERVKKTWESIYPRPYETLRKAGMVHPMAKLAAANYRKHYALLVQRGFSEQQADQWAANESFGLARRTSQPRYEIPLGEEDVVAAFEKWLSTQNDQGNRPQHPGVPE